MKKIIWDIIIAIILAIIAAIVVEIFHLNTYILVIIVLIIIIGTLISEIFDLKVNNKKIKEENLRINEEIIKTNEKNCYKEIGIERIIDKKIKVIPENAIFLEKARDHIYILGVSCSSFWEGSEAFLPYLAKAGKNNILIEILLLNPDTKGKYLKERAQADTITEQTLKNRINDSIHEFIDFKNRNNIKKINLYLYDEVPVWFMIIVDSVYARISYYPIGKPDNGAPYYVLNDKGDYTLINPFIKYFDGLKERSKKVDLTENDKY